MAMRTIHASMTTLTLLANRKHAKNRRDAIDAFFACCDPGWKDTSACRHSIGVCENQSGVRVVRSIRLHVVAPWPEILSRQYVLSMQHSDNAVARHRKLWGDIEDYILIVVSFPFVVIKDA